MFMLDRVMNSKTDQEFDGIFGRVLDGLAIDMALGTDRGYQKKRNCCWSLEEG